MDATDQSDYYRQRGAGFAANAHYKKWYKNVHLVILNFMILDAFFAWNMSVSEVEARLRVKSKEFLQPSVRK